MDIKKIIMFSFFTILFAVLIVVLCCSHEGVSVHIKNNTESELNDIVLEFTGGKETISQLPPGKTIAKLVNPAGESSLDVSYNIGKKSDYKKKLDIYIEPNYKGDLFIIIKDNGEISYDSKISLP